MVNLFISHSRTYTDAYEKLVGMLDEAPNFSYRNFSVPEGNPIHTSGTDKELYEAIKNKIQLCNAIVIMSGKYATYSKWIKKEIKICCDDFSVKKPIVAVHPWGSKQASSVVMQAADSEARWNTDSIVSAIRDVT